MLVQTAQRAEAQEAREAVISLFLHLLSVVL